MLYLIFKLASSFISKYLNKESYIPATASGLMVIFVNLRVITTTILTRLRSNDHCSSDNRKDLEFRF